MWACPLNGGGISCILANFKQFLNLYPGSLQKWVADDTPQRLLCHQARMITRPPLPDEPAPLRGGLKCSRTHGSYAVVSCLSRETIYVPQREARAKLLRATARTHFQATAAMIPQKRVSRSSYCVKKQISDAKQNGQT